MTRFYAENTQNDAAMPRFYALWRTKYTKMQRFDALRVHHIYPFSGPSIITLAPAACDWRISATSDAIAGGKAL